MNILDVSIIIFVILETLNVMVLYFAPDFDKGNGVAVFRHWEKSKEDEKQHLFVTYMKNWVAGTKVIFIALLIGILIVGNEEIKIFGVCAMILSIATYFFKLHPIIVKLDEMGEIKPKGYSKTLFKMIFGFTLMFVLALVVYFL